MVLPPMGIFAHFLIIVCCLICHVTMCSSYFNYTIHVYLSIMPEYLTSVYQYRLLANVSPIRSGRVTCTCAFEKIVSVSLFHNHNYCTYALYTTYCCINIWSIYRTKIYNFFVNHCSWIFSSQAGFLFVRLVDRYVNIFRSCDLEILTSCDPGSGPPESLQFMIETLLTHTCVRQSIIMLDFWVFGD